MSRELNHNTGQRGYRHNQADRFANERHDSKCKATKLMDEIKHVIDGYLEQDWSPEQIAGRLKLDRVIKLHHETIYQYVVADKQAGDKLYQHLRHQNKTYRKRYGAAHNRAGIPNRVDIDKRPEAANNRERVGDWEADTIIGKNHTGVIVILDDRKSKLRLSTPVSRKQASLVTEAIQTLLSPMQSWVLTITFDNEKEFDYHESIADTLGFDTYFAKPYQSWERGQNENVNGLLRQYFPKTMELIEFQDRKIKIESFAGCTLTWRLPTWWYPAGCVFESSQVHDQTMVDPDPSIFLKCHSVWLD